MSPETLDEKRKRLIVKYECSECGKVDEIVILERSSYAWKDDIMGYLRTQRSQETVEVRCAKCNGVLKGALLLGS